MIANASMKKTIAILIALTMLSGIASCTRMPKAKTAESKIKSFFIKYGKKYPDTQYGRAPVTKVDVLSEEEIHKNLVAVDAFLTLGDSQIEKISVTFERKAYWRIVSWEKLL